MNAKFATVIKRHQRTKNVEVEMRLGTITKQGFDTNVGKERYDRIHRALSKFGGWEEVVNARTNAYYLSNLRHVMNDDTDEVVTVVKKSVKKIDHAGHPMDVRLSIATETPCELDGEEVFERSCLRDRVSFVRKNVSIDLTVVTGDATDVDEESPTQYQVELEIVDPTKFTADAEIENMVQKMADVMKILA